MPRVLITGINGFIGRDLAQQLGQNGWQTLALERDRPGGNALVFDHTDSVATCARALEGVDAVIHLAGIAHRRATAEAYKTINADWPAHLFESATAAGVHTFIHMSSIKVLGDTSTRPLQPDDPYQPHGPYAESKRAAEERLLAQTEHLSPTIIRPPLVYGPGVGANFALLLKLAALGRRGMPLPLGCATAPRSLVSRSNLCSLVAKLLEGSSGVFHVGDARDWSVAEILGHWQVPPERLWPVSVDTARSLTGLLGQTGVFERLYLPLQIDQSTTLEVTDWRPDSDTGRELNDTLARYLTNH